METRPSGDIHKMRARLTEIQSEIRALIDDAEVEDRDFTAAENKWYQEHKAEADKLKRKIEKLEEYRAAAYEDKGDQLSGPARRFMADAVGGGSGLGAAITRAGFDLRNQPRVAIAVRELRDYPDAGDWSPRVIEGVNQLGTDERWLWNRLPGQDIGMDTSVTDFRQTGNRTVDGTIERDLDAVSDKATLAVAIEHVVEEVKMLAVLVEDIPTALLESMQGAQAFFNSEATYQLNQALDAHVYTSILAANPPTGDTGANIVEQVRHAVAAMRSVGSVPRLLVLNPTDAASLDLFQHGENDSEYMFTTRDSGVGSPLWGLQVIERTSETGDEPPMLIDPQRLGIVYTGAMSVLADPYTKMKNNLVDVRFEMRALAHIRRGDAAYVIDTPGDGDGDG